MTLITQDTMKRHRKILIKMWTLEREQDFHIFDDLDLDL